MHDRWSKSGQVYYYRAPKHNPNGRYSIGSTRTSYSLRNILSCLTLIRRSVSLNSYGMFHPRGPKFLLSCTRAWKKHRPNSRHFHSCYMHVHVHVNQCQQHATCDGLQVSCSHQRTLGQILDQRCMIVWCWLSFPLVVHWSFWLHSEGQRQGSGERGTRWATF